MVSFEIGLERISRVSQWSCRAPEAENLGFGGCRDVEGPTFPGVSGPNTCSCNSISLVYYLAAI
jgi:hypothetical protein